MYNAWEQEKKRVCTPESHFNIQDLFYRLMLRVRNVSKELQDVCLDSNIQ